MTFSGQLPNHFPQQVAERIFEGLNGAFRAEKYVRD